MMSQTVLGYDEDDDDKTVTVSPGRAVGNKSASSEDNIRTHVRRSLLQGAEVQSAPGEDGSETPSQIHPVVLQPVYPPPFPEWSDDFINQETWDVDSKVDYFEDVFAATDFINLKAYHWLKPSEYILTEVPSVVKFKSPTIDLINPNAHLCEKSEVIRYILGEISELFDCGIQNKYIECEGEGTVFVPNYEEDDRKWCPWHHIYSCCKAGVRGELPLYNPKGKYYVRLYFMGTWRRILVDDKIPILPSGQPGLPLTESKELWPLLLTKALLKIAILRWKGDDVKKFSTVAALTGWMFEWVDTVNEVSETELWTDLENTLPKYTDPKRIPSCYTLLKPSRKKLVYGSPEETDTFWWMPTTAVHPISTEDADFEKFPAVEFPVRIKDILSEPSQTEDIPADQPEALLPRTATIDITWERKAYVFQESLSPVRSPTTTGVSTIDTAAEEENEVKEEEEGLDAIPSVDVTRKTKKKKAAGLSGPIDDVKSERKSLKSGKKTKHKKHEESKATRTSFLTASKKGDRSSEKTELKEKVEEKPKPILDPKLRAAAKWNFVKEVFTTDAGEIMNKRVSNSVRKSYLSAHEITTLQLTNEIDERFIEKMREAEEAFVDSQPGSLPGVEADAVLPSVNEMVLAVQKYAGIDYRNMIKNWENLCGKDSPVTIFVVLKSFPPPEEIRPGSEMKPYVPAFLQHPMQLVEVRDTVLRIPTDRPETPLWKRFRWKAWAMRKGLIPPEEDRSHDTIRMVKVRTPFVFKTDWYDLDMLGYENEARDSEGYGMEWGGEGDSKDDVYDSFFVSLSKKRHSKETERNMHSPPRKMSLHISPSGTQTGGPKMNPDVDGVSRKRGSVPESQKPPPPVRPSMMNNDTSGMAASMTGLSIHSQPKRKSSKKKSNDEEMSKDENRATHSSLEVLHDPEIVAGESEGELDGFKQRMLQRQVSPTSASASVWFDCADIAQNLNKFCKFYTSQSIFGSCFTMRREPERPSALDSVFISLQRNEVPPYPEALREYKRTPNCFNVGVDFTKGKDYHVTDYHLDSREDKHSAFYLFSDCWTEQELIIKVNIIQESFLKLYDAATTGPLPDEVPGPPPTAIPPDMGPKIKPKHHELPLVLVMEPWDWRQDTGIKDPILCTWSQDSSVSHVGLPPGRNTFRIWLNYQFPHIHKHHTADKTSTLRTSVHDQFDECLRIKRTIPFNVRIVSQTPIYVGSRNEIQNYMTNPPMMLLKQSERLANNIWGLLACLGKKKQLYVQNLRQLRRSYCPTYSEPNLVNKYVRGTHDTFEELFLSLICSLNDGKLDIMLVQALRVLFLNPMLGRHLGSQLIPDNEDFSVSKGFLRHLAKKPRAQVSLAATTIQRYYRGWRVRYLFQVRRKTHRSYKRIEFSVRRIAFMLVQETDSLLSQKGTIKPVSDQALADATVDPEKVPPTLLPRPPHWSLAMTKCLLARKPILITLYPHAQCEPHHVKIQEVEGFLPQCTKDFTWYPFFREVILVPPEAKSCFLELDLQVYPFIGVYMKIINNDNGLFLRTAHNRHFVGRLFENKYGYTIFCYRWIAPTIHTELNDRPASPVWKLRIVTPYDQQPLKFQSKQESLMQKRSDEDIKRASLRRNTKSSSAEEILPSNPPPETEKPGTNQESHKNSFEEEFPKTLTIRRLSGYYTPNQDASVCQYILETDEQRSTISFRFVASNPDAKLRVVMWDCVKRATVYDEVFQNGIISPYINLHVVKPVQPQESQEPTKDSNGSYSSVGSSFGSEGRISLRSPLSATGVAAKLVEEVMNNKSYSEEESSEAPSHKGSTGDGSETTEHMRGNSVTDVATGMATEADAKTKILRNSGARASTDEHEEVHELKKSTNKRRFIISVYVVENSWALSDRELLYVLYRERKFFKAIKTHHCREQEKDVEAEIKKKADEEAAAVAAVAAAAAEAELESEQEEEEEEVAAPLPTVEAPSEKEKPVKKTAKELQSMRKKAKKKEAVKEHEKSVHREGSKDIGQPSEVVDAVSEASFIPLASMQGSPAYPTAPPPTQVSVQNNEGVPEAKEEKKEIVKIRRRMNGNLLMKYGGHQSHHIKRLDQPHWIMEIVTSQVKYKLQSNWQVLKKRLLQARDTWESGGVNLLYEELSTRLDYLLENMVEENFRQKSQVHKFSIVDPIHNLYSCLRLDMYNLPGLVHEDLVRTIIAVWSTNPVESVKAGEKLLKYRKTKRNPSGKQRNVEALLDYLPKTLRTMAETFQKRLEERELDKERAIIEALRKAEMEAAVEVRGEDEEEDEDDSVHDSITPAKSTRKASGKIKPRRRSKSTAHELNDRTSTPNAKQKEIPLIAEESNKKNIKPKKVPGGKADGKGKKAEKGRHSLQDKRPSMSPKGSQRGSVDEEAKQEHLEEDIPDGSDAEIEVRSIRGCEKIASILKQYEAFFTEKEGIRDELAEVMRHERRGKLMRLSMEDEPTKLISQKIGIGKYTVGKLSKNSEEESSIKMSEKSESVERKDVSRKDSKLEKANEVINKLLRWAYDYSFLPPTEEYEGKIEDPGELGMFIVRTIMEEQRQNELEKKLEAERLLAEQEEEETEE